MGEGRLSFSATSCRRKPLSPQYRILMRIHKPQIPQTESLQFWRGCSLLKEVGRNFDFEKFHPTTNAATSCLRHVTDIKTQIFSFCTADRKMGRSPCPFGQMTRLSRSLDPLERVYIDRRPRCASETNAGWAVRCYSSTKICRPNMYRWTHSLNWSVLGVCSWLAYGRRSAMSEKTRKSKTFTRG